MIAMKLRTAFVLLLALAAWPAAAQTQAFTNRATELKDQAAPEARTLASLPENTEVKVVARGGGWTRVETGGKSGWVRVFHLRFPATASTDSSGGGFLSGLSGAIGGRPKSQQAGIQTVGVRGLSPEDLKNASPDAAAFAKAKSYASDKPTAERFAKDGKLNTVPVDYQ
jgi:hypothetical protein